MWQNSMGDFLEEELKYLYYIMLKTGVTLGEIEHKGSGIYSINVKYIEPTEFFSTGATIVLAPKPASS